MKTKVGKVLVGLSEKDFKNLFNALKNDDQRLVTLQLMNLNLVDDEFDTMMEAIGNMDMVTNVASKVSEALYEQPEKPTHVVCQELCCAGSPTKYGVVKQAYTQRVKVHPNRMIRTVLVDENGKEV
jgi:hypothetical protein